MDCLWKERWDLTRRRHEGWWRGTDLVVSSWGNGLLPAGTGSADSGEGSSTVADRAADPRAFAAHERRLLASKRHPLDLIPFVYVDYGTVPLAELLGARAEHREETVWYRHTDLSPDNDRVLRFDPGTEAFKRMSAVAALERAEASNDYFVGAPALCPGLDVLAELRGPQELLMDLALEPEWVHRKLTEIQEASFTAMDALGPYSTYPDGSSFHAFFMLWAPVRAALAQCDAAAMISADMFAQFVVPYLKEFCGRVDRVLYHVDGPDALRTVDQLLEIEDLDAIEFTPGPQVPGGGDPRWYPLYRRIKEAGKSVQAVWMRSAEVLPLLDAVGPEGMYLMVDFDSAEEAEELGRAVAPYYRAKD